MKRPVRDSKTGTYTVKNKEFKELFGSREQVWNGTAYKTPGGLTKSQLVMNKHHRIVSAVKFQTAKKERRLEKYGFYAKKGKFGYVKGKATRKASKKSTRKNKNAISGGENEKEEKEEKEVKEEKEEKEEKEVKEKEVKEKVEEEKEEPKNNENNNDTNNETNNEANSENNNENNNETNNENNNETNNENNNEKGGKRKKTSKK
jgi:hypothetical protein